MRPIELRRITSGGTWIPQIDGLRFIAIVSVVLFHVMGQMLERTGHPVAMQARYAWPRYMIQNGDRGVQLFFVISGYIMARPFLRQYRLGGKAVSLKSYFLRRLTRLEPPYVLSLLLYAVALCAFGVPWRTLLPHLLASVFYLHSAIYRAMSTINFVTWSLEVEVQFYVLAPLLGNVYRVQNTLLRRGVLLAGMVAFGALNLTPHGIMGLTVLGQTHYFLAGLLLADLLEGHQPQARRRIAWDAVSVLGWPLVFLLPRVGATLAWLPLLIVPLYLAAFYGPASNWFFRRQFVAIAGGMCYSLYLMHMLIVSVCFKATRHLVVMHDFMANYAIQVATLGTCIALLGTAYFVVVERPCMDPAWAGNLWQRLKQTPR
jgi:peptidoglycan/LPS O-acetylase OafA/YrhL